jgi:diaminopimelate epimerase
MRFWKMSGAGNDFLAFDDRKGSLEKKLTPELISRICTRGLSVGGDGIIILRGDSDLSFRMIYYNSDGGRAAMCGNGGRCAAVLARELGMVEREPFLFRSDSGEHRAEILTSSSARIWMTEPGILFLRRELKLNGTSFSICLVDTGVPHAVVVTDDMGDSAFHAASGLRSHPEVGPEGANVDLVRIDGRQALSIRTFERGVEGETLACGTGALAAAFCLWNRKGRIELPVSLKVGSGLTLDVGRDDYGWWLRGEARIVYEGDLLDP